MITPDLSAHLHAANTKAKVTALSRQLAESNTDLTPILDYTLNHDEKVAFHAAWVFENMLLSYAEHYQKSIEKIMDYGYRLTNPSGYRHYAKVYKHLTSRHAPEAVQQAIAAINTEPMVEQCFDWLINPAVKVAVKSFACEVLFNLRKRHSWIAEELINQLHWLMQNGSPAIQATGRRMLKILQSESYKA